MNRGIQTLILLPLLIGSHSVMAEFECSGPDCNKINRDYGAYYSDFSKYYLPALAKDELLAQSFGSIALVPYHVTTQKFTVGIFGTASFTNERKIPVRNDLIENKTKNMGERGISLQPGGYAGVNIRWLASSLQTLFSKYDQESTFLDRFEVYGFGYQYGSLKSDQANSTATNLHLRGGMIRFTIIPEFGWGRFINFSGLSIGAGRADSTHNINIKFSDTLGIKTDIKSVEWTGNNEIIYQGTTVTRFGDIRTGASVLDFISIYLGIGKFSGTGSAFLSFSRDASYATFSDVTEYRFKAETKASDRFSDIYYIAGANIGPFTLQGMQTVSRKNQLRKAYAVTIGLTYRY